jgi:MFS transporter, FHS family, glucose/mannose:H+ symporter
MDPLAPRVSASRTPVRTLPVLHPAFALTGVFHAIGGPLLPSLAAQFHLTDVESGTLFLAYYAGTSLGALVCGRNYARSITLGFLALSFVCLGVAVTNRTGFHPLFLLLGVCVGVPMSAVSMLAGRIFGSRSAAPLTFLNFSWSIGALIAPLFAARVLLSHTYRSAYVILSAAAALAALAGWLGLKDPPDQSPSLSPPSSLLEVRLIVLFAILTFLEVGIENTAISWLATYVLRTTGRGAAFAAGTSSLYWWGFLASRGLSTVLLLRVSAQRLLGCSMIAALVAALVLIGFPGMAGHIAAMVVLGVALAPIFPLLLASFFANARQSSDSRWILAVCGFGGSVLPSLTGLISARSGSLRVGLVTLPAALLLMMLLQPLASKWRAHSRAISAENAGW